jgi:hypothetical protein
MNRLYRGRPHRGPVTGLAIQGVPVVRPAIVSIGDDAATLEQDFQSGFDAGRRQ